MSKKIVIVAGVASGLACLVPLTALAQAAAAAASPASAASAPSLEIARVVITAQKRKEDIRDVPLSVSVLSGEQLQAQQIGTVEDLTRNIPNVSFTSQGGPGLGTVEIRGVSSQAGTATVSTYLDDVSLTTRNLYSQGTAEPRFFDIQDIEVLRGPQGTLYGASSLGGTIKYISKQPDAKQFSGSASVDVSTTQHGGTNYQAEGVINLPLVKNAVALRVGVQSRPRQRLGRPGRSDHAEGDPEGHQQQPLGRREAVAEGGHRQGLERHAGPVRAVHAHRRHRRHLRHRRLVPVPAQRAQRATRRRSARSRPARPCASRATTASPCPASPSTATSASATSPRC